MKDFEKEVVQRSTEIPVLVDFWAEWCGPCRMLSPVLEKLAQKHAGEWELKKLNTEEFPDVAAQFGIRSIPDVKLFSKGSVIDEFVGALPEPRIEQWLAKALPDKYAYQLDTAESLIRQQKYEDARNVLEPVLSASPDHERARALSGLALVFVDRNRAIQLVSDIDEGSEYAEIAETIRTFDKVLSNFEHPDHLVEAEVKAGYLDACKRVSERYFDKALEDFSDVIRSDRYYDDDGSRKACIAIFRLLGEEHEITMRYRREFGNALYV